jgi:hypothetical protein
MAGSEQRPTDDVEGHMPSGTWTPRPPTRTKPATTPRVTASVTSASNQVGRPQAGSAGRLRRLANEASGRRSRASPSD